MDLQMMWLTKLLLAHLLTDFIFQPGKWIESKTKKHFLSPHLYWHVGLTVLVAAIFIGLKYWLVLLIILITHVLIDGFKSYRQSSIRFFLIDQALHVLVILACWYFSFLHWVDVVTIWHWLNTPNNWLIATGFVAVTQPASIIIGQLTRGWRSQIPNSDSLGNAGKWIGIMERILILVLILNHQYASVGLLMTAKSLLRFNEPNRLEVKTEYLLIGTLISFGSAALTGILLLQLTGL